MTRVLCLFVCLMLCLQAKAESILNIRKSADELYRSGKYAAAAKRYEQAVKNGSNNPNDCYSAACCWSLCGQKDAAFLALDKALKFGWTNSDHLRADSDLKLLHSDRRWQQLAAKSDSLKEYNSKRYYQVNQRLDSIYISDQHYRVILEDSIYPKYGRTSAEAKSMWQLAQTNDSLNLNEVLTIINRYGWLGPQEVGYQHSMTLFLVIQHSDIKTQEKYLPLLKKAVIDGKAMPEYYAALYDRVAVGEGRPQLYGTQVSFNEETKGYEVHNVQDREKLNERRKEFGMTTIEDYLKTFERK